MKESDLAFTSHSHGTVMHRHEVDGLSAEQRFFISWARVWADNDRPEFERLMITVNPHPLDQFRAVGAPSNMPEFAKAFACQSPDPMIRRERCQIW